MTDDAQVYNKEVKLQSQLDARIRIRGEVTKRLYEWLKAGDVVSVASEDAESLIQIRMGRGSCCGGNPEGFQLFVER